VIPIPTEATTESLADWAELWCAINPDGRASRSELQQVLVESQLDDLAIDNTWLELTRRETLLRGDYPYLVARTALLRTPWRRPHLTYCALLLIASGMTYDIARLATCNEEARLFEHIATRALTQYVSGTARRVGFPREDEVPAGFEEMLRFLRDELNEEGPLGNVMSQYPEAKDGGVDVVAWRPFRDRLSGQVIILGQCAIGKNWAEKLTEFSMERWRRYLGSVVPPVRAFLTPYAGTGSRQWGGVNLDGGMFLDRIRICEMVGVLPSGPLRRRIVGWCRGRVDTVTRAIEQGGWQA
jgi:hypothetical protein